MNTIQKQRSRIQTTEIRFLRKIEGKTKQGRIRNSTLKENLKINPTVQAVGERQMRWFGHVNRMGDENIRRRIFEARTFKRRKKGLSRRTCTEEIKATGEKRGGSWEEVKKKSQDWKKWKKM
jgi:hypothetical protein